jgi:hypothetical protein
VDAVAPFRLERKVAAERLRMFLQGRYLAPESVRTAATAESLDPVLVPFWVYDAQARSSYTGRLGLHWYETETYTVVVNGRVETRTRQVRRTEWFGVEGSHAQAYQEHLVSGSRGLPEAEANELEPFDVGAARPYAETLVAGLIAERPSIDHEEARAVAARELAQRENQAIRSFLPGDEVSGVENHTQVTIDRVRLVLLPVWISTYKHQGKVFRLMVNGQTGEVVGSAPRSWQKIGCAIGLGIIAFCLLLGCLAGAGGLASLLGGAR